MSGIDETHDPALRSWVASANEPDGDFPLQNLPFGVFQRDGLQPCCGVRIGDQVLDLAGLAALGLVDEACGAPSLNWVMELPADRRRALRHRLSGLLRHGSGERARVEPLLIPASQVRMLLPAVIGDYTDFYASIHHATNIGTMLRPDQPLLPNYKYIPIGYHGRSSTTSTSRSATTAGRRRSW
jgi:fumarylacetoacetase